MGVHTHNILGFFIPKNGLANLSSGLAASLGYGAASELIRRSAGSSDQHTSLIMTEGNIKRLVSKLTQMRGAALKLGQFMSIQGAVDCRLAHVQP